MTEDIAAFIAARLDEDEALAREAADGDSGRWFMGRSSPPDGGWAGLAPF